MLETNHWQVVARSLNGEREVDEQTFASVAALTERLEQLKRSDSAFSEVAFSPAVKRLQKDPVAVS
jgi:hypothetical protein